MALVVTAIITYKLGTQANKVDDVRRMTRSPTGWSHYQASCHSICKAKNKKHIYIEDFDKIYDMLPFCVSFIRNLSIARWILIFSSSGRQISGWFLYGCLLLILFPFSFNGAPDGFIAFLNHEVNNFLKNKPIGKYTNMHGLIYIAKFLIASYLHTSNKIFDCILFTYYSNKISDCFY